MKILTLNCLVSIGLLVVNARAAQDIAVQGETIYTMSGAAISNGVVLIRDGKISSVGTAASVKIPEGARVLQAKVVTPGLIDARTVVGFSGILNQPHDQEQLEKSTPIQPELRAIDGYNGRDPLVDYVRNFGVTTIHTGHAPGALVSGQTMIVKTYPANLEQALLNPSAMTAATLGSGATTSDKGKAPGTSAKAVAMLRAELIKAQDYVKKLPNQTPTNAPRATSTSKRSLACSTASSRCSSPFTAIKTYSPRSVSRRSSS